jgi:predicted nuclease of predicted toxin-antitoxin system
LSDQTLKFLADESCDFAFVRVLRQNEYDVKAIVEVMPGASDLKVLESGFEEKRVLLTEDKDFGKWIFSHKNATSGVILLRYPIETKLQMSLSIVEFVSEHGSKLRNRYVVLEPGRARIRTTR